MNKESVAPLQFKSLAELLNQKPDSALFKHFLELYGTNHSCTEIQNSRGDSANIYFFPNHGVGVKTLNDIVFQVVMHLRSPGVRDGSCTAYAGDLPFGIGFDDSEDVVKVKLSGDAGKMECYRRLKYHFSPFNIGFSFDKVTGKISLTSLTRDDYPQS
jgi:hypothetical protein